MISLNILPTGYRAQFARNALRLPICAAFFLICAGPGSTPTFAGNTASTAKPAPHPAKNTAPQQKSLDQLLNEFDGGGPSAQSGNRPMRGGNNQYGRRPNNQNFGARPRGTSNQVMLERLRQQIVGMKRAQEPLVNGMQGMPGGGMGGAPSMMQMIQQKMQGGPQPGTNGGGMGGAPGIMQMFQQRVQGAPGGGVPGMPGGAPAMMQMLQQKMHGAPQQMRGMPQRQSMPGTAVNGAPATPLLDLNNNRPGTIPGQSSAPGGGNKFDDLQRKLEGRYGGQH